MTEELFDGPGPRVFALPPGRRFALDFAEGLTARLAAPHEAARIEVAVNTARTARAMNEAFAAAADPAAWLPRIDTFDAFATRPGRPLSAPVVDRLERRLILTRLVEAALRREPELGPLSASGALADALAKLLDEMWEEGVGFTAIAASVDAPMARYWERTLAFLGILGEGWPAYLEGRGLADPGARRAAAFAALIETWRDAPPEHPVIAAGSTGSVAATADLLAAIARLPQGAVVLPGFDWALDEAGWAALGPDHPQYGFARLLERLELTPADVRPWRGEAAPDARARLLAEALRPAPVTHAWRAARGRIAAEAEAATGGLNLIEAETPRREAEAIALMIREALERPGDVALITNDRTLARRVTAQLSRWGVTPDDSAGRPLALSPPGILLTHVAALLSGGFDAARLLALLKHPLAAADRGEVWRLESLGLRDQERAHALTSPAALLAAEAKDGPLLGPSLRAVMAALSPWDGDAPLPDLVRRHREAAEALATDELWRKEAGEAALALMARFEAAAEAYGPAAPAAYKQLFAGALAEAEDLRGEPWLADPRVRILGQLEARAQSAETVILAGLNEGTWPAALSPDPWLNRRMRAAAGLPAPERRIGLAAHDFQTAAGAPRVALTRAVKAEGAPTDPARWLVRLETLLTGAAPEALAAMRARGARWTALAERMDETGAPRPAPRPEPRPPVAARPRALSVTEIQTLIRDPYAIYARRILGLRRLEPPGAAPDARLRGTVLHEAMERFVRATAEWPGEAAARAAFDRAADEAIAAYAPPPRLAQIWRARLARIAGEVIADETARRAEGAPLGAELKGELVAETGEGPFHLRGRADRVDRLRAGGVAIYDYKAGATPTQKQERLYAHQLELLAAMAESGGFEGLAATDARRLAYLSLKGGAGRVTEIAPDPEAAAGLAALIAAYDDPEASYPPRAAFLSARDVSDYDHLSRHGEWGGEEEEG